MPSPALAPPPAAVTPMEVYQQIGNLTRLLHDTMQQFTLHPLGVLPMLQQAADGIPDVRSRLRYIATQTALAADKVLTSVDRAKAEHAAIRAHTVSLAGALAADPVQAVASGAVQDFVNTVEARTQRIDGHLTDIMLAQDFHDLTGQVVARVVALANELEASLVKLLVCGVPPDPRERPDRALFSGPVVDPAGRADTVSSQGEVDELLAGLGF